MASDPPLRGGIAEYVAMFNALSLPSGYVYVDKDMLVHLVFIDMKNVRDDVGDKKSVALAPGNVYTYSGRKSKIGSSSSLELEFSADVIWNFRPETGIWTTTKDRTGDFESLCPIKCGGMPEVKRNA